MDELVTCEYCGNVWDGNAQCNCYESMIESDEQIMGLVAPSNHIVVETDEQIMGLVPPSNHIVVEMVVETGNENMKPIDETDDKDEVDTESLSSQSSIDEIIEL